MIEDSRLGKRRAILAIFISLTSNHIIAAPPVRDKELTYEESYKMITQKPYPGFVIELITRSLAYDLCQKINTATIWPTYMKCYKQARKKMKNVCNIESKKLEWINDIKSDHSPFRYWSIRFDRFVDDYEKQCHKKIEIRSLGLDYLRPNCNEYGILPYYLLLRHRKIIDSKGFLLKDFNNPEMNIAVTNECELELRLVPRIMSQFRLTFQLYDQISAYADFDSINDAIINEDAQNHGLLQGN
jgi:hypothetical protein